MKARLENHKGSEKSAEYDRAEVAALDLALEVLKGLKEARDRARAAE